MLLSNTTKCLQGFRVLFDQGKMSHNNSTDKPSIIGANFFFFAVTHVMFASKARSIEFTSLHLHVQHLCPTLSFVSVKVTSQLKLTDE
jgi:hypothetical protein